MYSLFGLDFMYTVQLFPNLQSAACAMGQLYIKQSCYAVANKSAIMLLLRFAEIQDRWYHSRIIN